MPNSVTQDETQNHQFPYKCEGGGPASPGGVGPEKKGQTGLKSGLFLSGRTGCQQPSGLICNSTRLPNPCELLFTCVCELFRTLAAMSDRDITQTAVNRKREFTAHVTNTSGLLLALVMSGSGL